MYSIDGPFVSPYDHMMVPMENLVLWGETDQARGGPTVNLASRGGSLPLYIWFEGCMSILGGTGALVLTATLGE